MIQNFIPAGFKHDHSLRSAPQDHDLIFSFSNNRILLMNSQIPQWKNLKHLVSPDTPALYCFGQFNQQDCLLLEWPGEPIAAQAPFAHKNIRFCYESLGEALFLITGLGNQLQYWCSRHIYCGQCGSKTQLKTNERAMLCPNCDFIAYPQLYPCIIVLVTRGRQLLLAHSPHFLQAVYSTLAGFIEPGESAEDAVQREVKEEVNLNIKNIRYVYSQPWPFPNSLMLGFLAEYESGEIQIDHQEIEDAQWFEPENLPKLPLALSISRFLIETHLNNNVDN